MQKAILSFLAVWAFSIASLAQQQPKSSILEYEGNQITVAYEYETVTIEDPENGNIVDRVMRREKPDLLNGNQIYQGKEADEPIGSASQSDLKSFIRTMLADELKEAGNFFMSMTLILNEEGKPAFLNVRLRNHYSLGLCSTNIDEKTIQSIKTRMKNQLYAHSFVPARKEGRAVPYLFHLSSQDL